MGIQRSGCSRRLLASTLLRATLVRVPGNGRACLLRGGQGKTGGFDRSRGELRFYLEIVPVDAVEASINCSVL